MVKHNWNCKWILSFLNAKIERNAGKNWRVVEKKKFQAEIEKTEARFWVGWWDCCSSSTAKFQWSNGPLIIEKKMNAMNAESSEHFCFLILYPSFYAIMHCLTVIQRAIVV